MAYNPTRFITNSLLSNNLVNYYTVPSTCLCLIIYELTFCNTDLNNVHTFTIYIIPPSVDANDSNTEFKSVKLQPGETKKYGMHNVLLPGYTVQAISDISSQISISGSGVLRT